MSLGRGLDGIQYECYGAQRAVRAVRRISVVHVEHVTFKVISHAAFNDHYLSAPEQLIEFSWSNGADHLCFACTVAPLRISKDLIEKQQWTPFLPLFCGTPLCNSLVLHEH